MEGSTKFDPKKLPDTNVPLDNLKALEKYFKFVDGAYDRESERVYWLLEVATNIDVDEITDMSVLEIALFNADGVRLNRGERNSKIQFARKKDARDGDTIGGLGTPRMKKGDRIYGFLPFLEEDTFKEIRKAQVQKRK